MRIVRITEQYNGMHLASTCWVRLEDPKWHQNELSILFLTNDRWGCDARPSLDTKYLLAVPGTFPAGIVPEEEKRPSIDPINQWFEHLAQRDEAKQKPPEEARNQNN